MYGLVNFASFYLLKAQAAKLHLPIDGSNYPIPERSSAHWFWYFLGANFCWPFIDILSRFIFMMNGAIATDPSKRTTFIEDVFRAIGQGLFVFAIIGIVFCLSIHVLLFVRGVKSLRARTVESFDV